MHLCIKNFFITFETYSASVTSKWSPNKLVMLQQQRCIETTVRSSHSEVFLGKGVLKICSKFTGEHPCRSMISIKLLCNFVEIALRHECSPINLLHIIRTPFLKKTSEWLLLKIVHQILANLQTDNLIANNLQRKCCTRQALFHLQQLVIFYQHL